MTQPIDRQSVLRAYSPVMTDWDGYSPLSVGNGEFAFTCDLTGLQTFPQVHHNKMPLCTMAQWGWHTKPYKPEQPSVPHASVPRTRYFNGEREVPYFTKPGDHKAEFDWLRQNPHRYHLGRVGLRFPSPVQPEDLTGTHQRLELYSGIIESRFEALGASVAVTTCVHPHEDTLAVRIESSLVAGGLGVVIQLPEPSILPAGGDFDSPETHISALARCEDGRFDILHAMHDDRCFLSIRADGAKIDCTAPHTYEITSGRETLDISVHFDKSHMAGEVPTFAQVATAAGTYWNAYWQKGGFVHIRAGGEAGAELQRRVLLSQYLTAIQCAGSLPPAETGLTTNSWYGKYHLEMHWWHAAHFPLWNRPQLLERSLWYYHAILPRARDIAAEQGYPGVRWPKMTDPTGLDSPSPIGPLLIWQQPHPIYYAELMYRQNPAKQTLERYFTIVEESARFMAAYARFDEATDRYVLGPGVIPAQENHKPEDTLNPTFELEYWAFGLRTANLWRQRLGLPEYKEYDHIIGKIAKPTVQDGAYLAHENCPDTFTGRFNRDHPSMTAALGLLPGTLIDPDAMNGTLNKILGGQWQLDTGTWGWDFPTLAMTAARLNRPQDAVNLLLYPAAKNDYLPNGHNKQADRADLPLYLPGNGGLLFAVAMMCAGWDGCESKTPGFPKEWDVAWENLSPAP